MMMKKTKLKKKVKIKEKIKEKIKKEVKKPKKKLKKISENKAFKNTVIPNILIYKV